MKENCKLIGALGAHVGDTATGVVGPNTRKPQGISARGFLTGSGVWMRASFVVTTTSKIRHP